MPDAFKPQSTGDRFRGRIRYLPFNIPDTLRAEQPITATMKTLPQMSIPSLGISL